MTSPRSSAYSYGLRGAASGVVQEGPGLVLDAVHDLHRLAGHGTWPSRVANSAATVGRGVLDVAVRSWDRAAVAGRRGQMVILTVAALKSWMWVQRSWCASPSLRAVLDDLLRQLVERRNGRAATVPLEEPKWLFHSTYPG
ncbi:hypothetical protein ACH41H_46070 [Streptomyces sp. NPDC020800]|uniref:hypothetical protein n=1 Tax=Streptomyces sp. NPDC020800 TaxID=3365092 RepID=UPI0037B3E7D1